MPSKKMFVRDANNQLQEIVTSPAHDEVDDAIRVKSMQKKMRDSFPGAAVNAAKWDVSVGAGGSVSVASGLMVLASGTTANSETSVLSKETFTIPFRMSVGLTMSQRIANQGFYLEAVSVNPTTGVPDGQNSMSWYFDATTNTQAKYGTSAEGMAELQSGAVTVPATTGVSMYELEAFSDEAWFHAGGFDAVTGRSQSYRRNQRSPDPNATYKLRLRWKNGASAPASSTNVTLYSVAVEDYVETMAELIASRGGASVGQAMPVNVSNVPAVSISGTPAVTISGTSRLAPTPADGFGTASKLIATASTNATSVRNAATILGLLTAHNVSAAVKYLKIYNKASAPTVGTDVPIHTIPIPAGGMVNFPIPAAGLRLTTGFALAITGGIADADTTAVAAGDVVVNWEYN